MDLIKKEYADKAVEACVTSFHVEAGVTEYQVLLTIKEPTMPFVEQLRNIQQVYQEVVTEELPGDAVAVFRRYFLSDAANQLDGVMSWECENAFCALSVVQQAPLNGTKVAMWTYLQTGMVAERTCRPGWSRRELKEDCGKSLMEAMDIIGWEALSIRRSTRNIRLVS